MAAARRLKRVVATQPGFLSFSENKADVSTRRKRVNKNKKKNWNKHSDINDVEDFLEDIRHQERTTGGLLAEKPDDSLFFLDAGHQQKDDRKASEQVKNKKRKGKSQRPLRIDLILQHDSLVPPIKDVLAYQQPNAKKLRNAAKRVEHLAAKGVVPRSQKKLLNRQTPKTGVKKAVTEANNYPKREYYDIWGQESKSSADPWYLQQTGKKRVKRPEKMNDKPSTLPAVEVIAPGGSYNPDFFSHQALLQEAHNVEIKKQKAEKRIERRLAVDKDKRATEETIFQEQVEGLVEENEDDEVSAINEDDKVSAINEDDKVSAIKEEEEGTVGGAIVLAEKKTERQRKKEKAEKIKEQQRLSEKNQTNKRQQLFQLRSIKATIKQQEKRTAARQKRRKAKMEAQKSQPRRLGKLKFQADDIEIKLSDELRSSLRELKPEGSVLKDRFKSLQKRNLIEPRERAKFKRKYKLKYVEKRAFREIT
ncbi:ribosome biogenesis protein NOP53 [Corythoichthys intestinalis]|uniref:ribosome biogenesis protein NOP53 n=1 Tax=Corythoichthys intestinalis TaxID=161448 RepID=UPI0025A5D4AD|nr:ribosome biogenesis protein NOP53 [Corythoichthys intestinalis]XP_061797867.1 ribosome biogenesis protein NOP53 [Nerophis lumbriciformis]